MKAPCHVSHVTTIDIRCNADLQFAEDKDLERYARDSEVLRDLEEAQLHRAVAAEQEQQVGAASSQPECMHRASTQLLCCVCS